MDRDVVLQIFGQIVAVLIGVTLGAALVEFKEQPFSDWLFKYQTLLTGFMAILAAVITVSQMKRSDRLQQLRHRDAMKKMADADLKKLQRAAIPYAQYLRDNSERVRKHLIDNWSEFSDAKIPRTKVEELIGLSAAMSKLADNASIRDAVNLFDPITNAVYETYREHAAELMEPTQRMTGVLATYSDDANGVPVVISNDVTRKAFREFAFAMTVVVPAANGFGYRLQEMLATHAQGHKA